MDELWQKILELAIQNTISHSKRVDILAELYIAKAGEKDPLDALKILKEFKKESDDNIEKLLTLSPKILGENKPSEPKPKTPIPNSKTSREKLVQLKEVIDKIIGS